MSEPTMPEITKEWLEEQWAAYAQKHTSAPCLRCRVEQRARTTTYPALIQWALEALVAMERIKALGETLQDLVDLQNGPPLPKYAAYWEAVMERAKALLKEVPND